MRAILVLVLGLSRAADAGSLHLNSVITDYQENFVKQGVCESRWEEIASTIGIQRHPLDANSDVILIPCANWASNLAWSVFVRINEASNPDGEIIKSQVFVTYTPYKKITGDNVIFNIHWDQEEKGIVAEYHLSLSGECGTRAFYKWNPEQQSIDLQLLMKRDNCKPGGIWEIVIDQRKKAAS